MSPAPDARDGLTPVTRAILEMLRTRTDRWTSAAEILRRVVGSPAPSLDAALVAASRGEASDSPHVDAYLALVEMVQPFRMRYPLVEGQGNFGSLDGDPPIDPAFTQVRILPVGEETVRGEFPNLLVNGAGNRLGRVQAGVLPHHVGEILDAARDLVRDPGLSDDALLDRVPGPDFPTGGVIPRQEEARAADRTGQGTVTVRARLHSEVVGAATVLVVSEIPFGVPKSRIVEEISAGLHDRRLEGAADVLDESTAERVRVVLVLSRDADPAVVQDRLLRDTSLETALDVSMDAVIDGVAARVTLPALIRSYVGSCRARVQRESGDDRPEGVAERASSEIERIRGVRADARRTQIE